MTLDQLRTLDAVVQYGGFRQAAEQLCRTQAAVSKAIKVLERQLGFELFRRDGYRAEITEAGRAFYLKSQPLLAEAARLHAFGRILQHGSEPRLQVAINHICPLASVLDTLKQCQDRFPATEIDIDSESMYGALDSLLRGDANLAISFLDRHQPDLQTRPIGTVTLLTVATAGLAKKGIASSPQVVVRDSSVAPTQSMPHVSSSQRTWEVNDFHTKKEIILQGLGWGRMPEHLIRRELELAGLRPLEAPLQIDIHLIRRKSDEHGPAANHLWENIRLTEG